MVTSLEEWRRAPLVGPNSKVDPIIPSSLKWACFGVLLEPLANLDPFGISFHENLAGVLSATQGVRPQCVASLEEESPNPRAEPHSPCSVHRPGSPSVEILQESSYSSYSPEIITFWTWHNPFL